MKPIQAYTIPIFEWKDDEVDMDLIERESKRLLDKGCEIALIKTKHRFKNMVINKTMLNRKPDSSDDYKFILYNEAQKIKVGHERIKDIYPFTQKLLVGKVEIVWFR